MPRNIEVLNQLFIDWLTTNASRFPFQPKVLRKRKSRIIEFNFSGIPGEIRFSFNSRSGISVAIMYKGDCWDCMGDFDVAEEHGEKGWFCGLDEEEKRQYWETREQMWMEHCFERFLAWCLVTLAQARYLTLYKYRGCTWAKLLPDKKDREEKDRVALISIGGGHS